MQLTSQIVPSPTNVYLNYGMMWKLVVKDLISCRMDRLAVAADCSMWLLGVPAHTLGAVGLAFWNEDSGEM